ncbi:Legionaminic acid cytidylyltransferase [Anaerovibrio sp. JC8]|uniref:acylneuraminate cytidylyltransferase family protein n=1 Tax=Anaerovibrio sp. JC8 TaxID=1240085 RepID=UPI000A0BF728|nr:acylneuraminate cytidylyltransferase family protein [Anaerovibrio sp. JC8]ORU01005.1 Legionaminic acid cytidylyltransferase [Anaerovibrio sp. JC8]
MRTLFTICGRAGSKGIKNKNIKPFLGRPLPFYTLSVIDLYLKGHSEIKYDIVVNSDSDELLAMMAESGLRPVETIKRVPELSGDVVGKVAVIKNCLKIMEARKEYKYDMVVDLDITSPLRRVIDLENVINKHIEKKADVTTTVATARRNPYFNQVKKTEHGYKKVIDSNFTARQQAPEIFDMNASLYAYSPEFLNSGKGVLDGYCEVIEMFDTAVLDLDHENDFELMEVIANYLFSKYYDFGEIRDNIG